MAEMVILEDRVNTMDLCLVGVVVRDMGEMMRVLNYVFADERDNVNADAGSD
ncbi:uncharacterized protein TRAVEDRAFT_44573 [Trametes versicolor FP-101664 SS1]|uniref:uncharacterized protein n=1 Tax=Trametes versicolor (strain FP-101664) TaxID=717944 RepID=UPI0004621D2D|nr:uncharacterized protein TRAVEDRAFT_44573 [Trametes versicolor FP-101664 SS1]EIW61755.1 hypothetical protein TRAVEDRAFT_44573 [Trametes versicolor FP-101664 SS1]